VQQPVYLVRGESPHGPAQYKACPSNALSAELVKLAAAELVQALSPLCIDIVARNEVQQDWDGLMWKYDQANAKLKEYITSEGFQQANGKAEMMKSLQEMMIAMEKQQGSLQFDLNKYIVEQTIQQLATLMGQEEARLRSAPPAPSSTSKEMRIPITFHLFFHMIWMVTSPLASACPLSVTSCVISKPVAGSACKQKSRPSQLPAGIDAFTTKRECAEVVVELDDER